MIRSAKFLISQSPYAVDLGSFTAREVPMGTGLPRWRSEIGAVWFRRRAGKTQATVGTLRGFIGPKHETAEEFLTSLDDSRYGGHCEGRWDGYRYWGSQDPELITDHLLLLRSMHEHYPAVPAGFDGWWRFR